MSKQLLTSHQWQQIHPDPVVMDPDGWDRTNYQFSWFEELITEGEYFVRRMSSTCMGKIKKPDPVDVKKETDEVSEYYKIMDKEVHSNRANLNN